MRTLAYLLLFISTTGCQKYCCEVCSDNLCKCNGKSEQCYCATGSCNCRFVVDKNDDYKYNHIKKHLPIWSVDNATAH